MELNMKKINFYFLLIISIISLHADTPVQTSQDTQPISQQAQSQKETVKGAKKEVVKNIKKSGQTPTNKNKTVEKNSRQKNESAPKKNKKAEIKDTAPSKAEKENKKEEVTTTAQENIVTSEQLIDAIVIIIFSDEGAEIITRSDIDKPSLSGVARSVDDIIFERLVYLDAKKHKILPDEDAVDKYLTAIQREHNLKPEELQMIFLQAGYTLEEGREQLKMMQAVNSMLDYKIRSNLIVPRKQVEVYYAEHPEFQEASYLISYTKVSFDPALGKEEQYAALVERAKTGDFIGVLWEGPFWIIESDLAENKQFITQLEPGQISVPFESTDGFELYRLEEKKARYQRTIEERYLEIVDILRKPKYEELLDNYRKSLFGRARIEYVQ